MNRVSGDFWRVFRVSLPGRPPINRRTYTESWIVDAPEVRWSRCSVNIRGAVRFWQGTHPATTLEIVIGWSGGAMGPAQVTFTDAAGSTVVFSCAKTSSAFRDVAMEVDVCASVNQAPLLPTYDTLWHDNRPADLTQRTLTIETAYDEAGVEVKIDPSHTAIDDSATEFQTWSPAELHDAMETHFSLFGGAWPAWRLWGLLAGTFDNAGVGGIMFDAAAQFGGAGKAPERQGFAVFRKHSWFDNLTAGTPANQDQAWAMRHFLYTWVHEAGHAYNLLHSWNKNRPDALSWMNYDWRYDQRNGQDTFWKSFRFRFDDDELLHIRHGDRAAVIMGGDPWASGGHLEAPALAAEVSEDMPLELLLRSNSYFDLMEPVQIELRLRNRTEFPIAIDGRLSPEFGGVRIQIRRPDGRTIEYAPVYCALGTKESITLEGTNPKLDGADRYSREVFLSYGRDGFYFDHPGEYLIRAAYQGSGEHYALSNVHRIRIGTPPSKDLDRVAGDFFRGDTGLALYLNGSRSPHLKKGLEVLETVAERTKGELIGAKIAMQIAEGRARSFFRMPEQADPRKKAKLTRAEKADPAGALRLTEPALKTLRGDKTPTMNLCYGRLIRRRANYHQAAGNVEAGKREIAAARKELSDRGVHAKALTMYEKIQKNL
jgi:hypothetical protein